MDPADVGVGDSNIIGISSQSGKSGILWLLEHTIELQPPKELAIVFCQTIKRLSMEQKREIAADEICNLFLDTYHLAGLDDRGKAKLFHARDHRAISIDIKDIHREINNKLGEAGEEVIVREILAEMSHVLSISLSCSQHSSHPTDQRAETAAYVRCAIDDSTESWGVGLGPDISAAYVSAVLSSLMTSKAFDNVRSTESVNGTSNRTTKGASKGIFNGNSKGGTIGPFNGTSNGTTASEL